MTIDATQPTDQAILASIPDYIRDGRVEINLLWAAITAANSTETTHVMGAGESKIITIMFKTIQPQKAAKHRLGNC